MTREPTRPVAEPYAICIRLGFWVEGAPCEIFPEYDPEAWPLDDDEAICEALRPKLREQIVAALRPLSDHLANLGCVRADATLSEILTGARSEADAEVTFYLIGAEAAERALTDASFLADFGSQSFSVPAIAGAKLHVEVTGETVAVQTVFESLQATIAEASVGTWGGPATPESLPQPHEEEGDWLARVAVSTDRIARLAERWRRSGQDVGIFPLCGTAEDRPGGVPPIEWVVPGLIPRGCVTLLVGTNMSGKSTMLAELAAVVDSDQPGAREFLGASVEGHFTPVTVSGEDPESIAAARAVIYQDVHGPGLGFWIDGAARPWRETLSLLSTIPNPGLIIVDPVRAFMDGNEDSSGVVSLFYDDLTALAREKNCAVVAAHHLSKGTPRSLANVQMMVRGSGVHTDRARLVIGMIKRSDATVEIGIIKSNFPPSEPMWGKLNEGRLFTRDAATLTLRPLSAEPSPGKPQSQDIGLAASLLAALETQNTADVVVRRTGRCELYELRLPQLAGVARNTVRAGISSLIEQGAIIADDAGLRIAPPQLAHSAAI